MKVDRLDDAPPGAADGALPEAPTDASSHAPPSIPSHSFFVDEPPFADDRSFGDEPPRADRTTAFEVDGAAVDGAGNDVAGADPAPDASTIEDLGALGDDAPAGVDDRLGGLHEGAADEHEAPTFLAEVPVSFPTGDADGDASTADEASPRPAPIARREAREAPRPPDTVMLVNDVVGDECRIALVRKGRLESFFGERAATATNVGNIYKGRVTNVEPAIQAAFVDFGENQNGFLHVSDLHPRYFPGADRTEAVGRKIPRRDRPPIQEALRRGQEILVQVIKEGLGTKGPTLTSYLSIPGRLLVMMPEMDNVGVSRKVEDEGQRRAMRQILDSLDLPDGFGFILRTAGFDRSRNELQRDAAYLMRLWQAMEQRMKSRGAPCELYTESDLLVRTIRDIVDDSVHTIVVDSVSAYDRASLFLDVAFPMNPPAIRFYDGPAPLFHAFGVEPQVRSITTREVPLPSGGALVFDQAEAMVAIDVNSGKSRSARDSETNAYNTNKEAVDEICRQLRLRDLGGLVVCDLIDMRLAKHRRDIEERFRENLKRDRAKTTVLPVSEFGMVELTRQRMRPSVQKMHFMACPHCEGLGDVKIPDSTASEALRDVQALLGHPRVHRVEMVCSVKVASVLLSGKRQRLYEMERRSGKRVDVRISEALPVDRVDLYGYDDRGADVELERLGATSPPALESLPAEPPEDAPLEPGAAVPEESRRRRRRRRVAPADAASIALAGGFDDLPEVRGDEPSALEEIRERERRKAEAPPTPKREPARTRDSSEPAAGEGGRRKRRRRGGRGRRKHEHAGAEAGAAK
ncbi:MAG: Rne/Rng family ribonuclease, partial [Phycisphaerae bacterium]|nr:Rne/Rng family ribonuclease [Phycisphaerae bacterium]